MKNKKLLIALLALCAVNFAAHLVFYPALPETVPIHWGFDGQADGWGSKATILVMAALPFLAWASSSSHWEVSSVTAILAARVVVRML